MIELQQTGIRGCANAKSSDNLKEVLSAVVFVLCVVVVLLDLLLICSLYSLQTQRERERVWGRGGLASSVNLISSCALISHTPQNSDNSHASTRLCITDLTYHCQQCFF